MESKEYQEYIQALRDLDKKVQDVIASQQLILEQLSKIYNNFGEM